MRGRTIQIFLFSILITFGMTVPARADLAERLMRLLVDKGVITAQEAQALRAELEAGESAAGEPEETAKTAPAKAPPHVEAKSEPNYLSVGEHVRFNGDLRLRYDGQFRDLSSDSYARHRGRFRLRFGVEADVADPLKVGFRLASGSGIQNTTSQSFDEHGRGKNIFVDRAYAAWSPQKWITVLAGRHRNPFVTSSLTWDSDVNLEGVAEQLRWEGEQVGLFGNLSQFFLEELNIRESDADPMMLGYQGGVSFETPSGTDLTLAASYYDFRNLDLIGPGGLSDSFTFQGFNQQNHQQMVYDENGRLLNEFDVVELNAELRFNQFAPAPLTLFGTYLNNTSADIEKLRTLGVAIPESDPADLFAYGDDDRGSAYQLGLDLGYEGHRGDWKVGYLYQVLEDYAFPAVFASSDFHGGGTNNRGHKGTIDFFLSDRVLARGSFFFTQRDQEAKDGRRDENRVQLDMIFDF